MNSFNQIPQILGQLNNLVPAYCDKCGTKHVKADLEILEHTFDRVVCKLNCTACQNSYMIHVSMPTEGLISAKRAPTKTDISAMEYKKFSSSEKINQEEILDVFIALKDVQTVSDLEVLLEGK